MELYKVILGLIKDEDFLSHICYSQYWRHFFLICLTKFVPCLQNSYPITCHWWHGGRSGCIALPMCNLGVGLGWLSVPCPGCFTTVKEPGTPLYRLGGHWGKTFCFLCVDCAAPQDKLVARILLAVLSRPACTLKWVTEFVHSWVCGSGGAV
jgi:hypothetical protein